MTLEIDKKWSDLSLSTDCLAVHIRRGDKTEEADYDEIDHGTVIERLSGSVLAGKKRKIFLFADDYKTYLDLRKELPGWDIVTAMTDVDTGFQQNAAFGNFLKNINFCDPTFTNQSGLKNRESTEGFPSSLTLQ